MTTHEKWMQLALELAEKGRYTVSPNPMVGCVIVKKGQMIAQAWHQKAGCLHAEIIALQQAADEAKSACLYLTLEPCCHTGKTPPCVDKIIQAGVKTVVIAIKDNNPQVSGKSIQLLKKAGIEVIVGVCKQQAKALNAVFFHAMEFQRPYVIAKWAMSLDGYTRTARHDSKRISAEQAQIHVHQQRRKMDAILIGAKTLLDDDPQLTARIEGQETWSPIRIVLVAKGELPTVRKIFTDQFAQRTWVITTDDNTQLDAKKLIQQGVHVFRIKSQGDALCPKALMRLLHQYEIRSVYIEGGQKTHAYFFAHQLVDEIHSYLAPCVVADLVKKQKVVIQHQHRLGDDIFIQARIDVKEK